MVRKSLMTSFVIAVVMLVLCSVSVWAEGPTQKPSAMDSSIVTALGISRDTMVLDGKEEDYVFFCKRRYEITTYTVIKNEWGMVIPLDDLEVPCKAMVSYYKKPGVKNTYVAVSIDVQGRPAPQPD